MFGILAQNQNLKRAIEQNMSNQRLKNQQQEEDGQTKRNLQDTITKQMSSTKTRNTTINTCPSKQMTSQVSNAFQNSTQKAQINIKRNIEKLKYRKTNTLSVNPQSMQLEEKPIKESKINKQRKEYNGGKDNQEKKLKWFIQNHEFIKFGQVINEQSSCSAQQNISNTTMKTLKSERDQDYDKQKSHSVDTNTEDLCQNNTTDPPNSDQRASNQFTLKKQTELKIEQTISPHGRKGASQSKQSKLLLNSGQTEEKELSKSICSKVSSDEKSLRSKDYVDKLKMINHDSSTNFNERQNRAEDHLLNVFRKSGANYDFSPTTRKKSIHELRSYQIRKIKKPSNKNTCATFRSSVGGSSQDQQDSSQLQNSFPKKYSSIENENIHQIIKNKAQILQRNVFLRGHIAQIRGNRNQSTILSNNEQNYNIQYDTYDTLMTPNLHSLEINQNEEGSPFNIVQSKIYKQYSKKDKQEMMRKNVSKSALVVHKQNQKDIYSLDNKRSGSDEEEILTARKNPAAKINISNLLIEENDAISKTVPNSGKVNAIRKDDYFNQGHKSITNECASSGDANDTMTPGLRPKEPINTPALRPKEPLIKHIFELGAPANNNNNNDTSATAQMTSQSIDSSHLPTIPQGNNVGRQRKIHRIFNVFSQSLDAGSSKIISKFKNKDAYKIKSSIGSIPHAVGLAHLYDQRKSSETTNQFSDTLKIDKAVVNVNLAKQYRHHQEIYKSILNPHLRNNTDLPFMVSEFSPPYKQNTRESLKSGINGQYVIEQDESLTESPNSPKQVGSFDTMKGSEVSAIELPVLKHSVQYIQPNTVRNAITGPFSRGPKDAAARLSSLNKFTFSEADRLNQMQARMRFSVQRRYQNQTQLQTTTGSPRVTIPLGHTKGDASVYYMQKQALQYQQQQYQQQSQKDNIYNIQAILPEINEQIQRENDENIKMLQIGGRAAKINLSPKSFIGTSQLNQYQSGSPNITEKDEMDQILGSKVQVQSFQKLDPFERSRRMKNYDQKLKGKGKQNKDKDNNPSVHDEQQEAEAPAYSSNKQFNIQDIKAPSGAVSGGSGPPGALRTQVQISINSPPISDRGVQDVQQSELFSPQKIRLGNTQSTESIPQQQLSQKIINNEMNNVDKNTTQSRQTVTVVGGSQQSKVKNQDQNATPLSKSQNRFNKEFLMGTQPLNTMSSIDILNNESLNGEQKQFLETPTAALQQSHQIDLQ